MKNLSEKINSEKCWSKKKKPKVKILKWIGGIKKIRWFGGGWGRAARSKNRCTDTLEGDREFCALGWRLATLCRPAGVIWVVGREIGNFVPWEGN